MAQIGWTCAVEGHVIQIKTKMLGLKEIVYYDGMEVACGWSFFGGDYRFSVQEDRGVATYHVRIDLETDTKPVGHKITIKRNDVLVYSEKTT